MKINWKVRLRNPVFWLTVIPSAVALVYSILSIFGVVPGISESVVIDALTTIVSGLATLGVLVDPTTAGISDSEQALTYTAPKREDYGADEVEGDA